MIQYAADYKLSLNNRMYIIPEEALDINDAISINTIDLWAIQ